MEDAVAVKDSEEATLHCSIRGCHIAILWRTEHAPVCVREFIHTIWVDTESIF